MNDEDVANIFQITLLPAIGFLLGIAYMGNGVGKYLLRQRIMNTPTSKVHAVAIGLTEVFGKAKCKEELISPISKQKCVYYKIVAQYYDERVAEYYFGNKSGGWQTIYTDEEKRQFYAEDEMGKIEIDLTQADMDVTPKIKYEGALEYDKLLGEAKGQIDEKVLRFVDELPPSQKRKFIACKNNNMRISEYYIAKNERVYVLGTAMPRPNVKSTVGIENLILKFGRDGVLYISDTHERKIVEKLRNSYRWEIGGGFTLALISLFALLILITKLIIPKYLS